MLNIAEECRERDIPFVCDPSQQVTRFDGEQLREFMLGAKVLVMNAYEASMISQKTGLSAVRLAEQIPVVLITRSAEGVDIHENGFRHHVPPFPVSHIADPTGAGDAFRGGIIRGLAAGWPLILCAQVGSLCASYTLEQVGTQTHSFTLQEYIDRFRSDVDDNGQLEQLLSASTITGN